MIKINKKYLFAKGLQVVSIALFFIIYIFVLYKLEIHRIDLTYLDVELKKEVIDSGNVLGVVVLCALSMVIPYIITIIPFAMSKELLKEYKKEN